RLQLHRVRRPESEVARAVSSLRCMEYAGRERRATRRKALPRARADKSDSVAGGGLGGGRAASCNRYRGTGPGARRWAGEGRCSAPGWRSWHREIHFAAAGLESALQVIQSALRERRRVRPTGRTARASPEPGLPTTRGAGRNPAGENPGGAYLESA